MAIDTKRPGGIDATAIHQNQIPREFAALILAALEEQPGAREMLLDWRAEFDLDNALAQKFIVLVTRWWRNQSLVKQAEPFSSPLVEDRINRYLNGEVKDKRGWTLHHSLSYESAMIVCKAVLGE